MDLPSSIRVLAYDIEVVSPDPKDMDLNGVDGRYLGTAQRLEVRGDRPPDMTRDILLHELLHAVLGISGAHAILDIETEFEEKLILSLSPVLLLVLRDNPDLVDYLMDDA